MFTLDPVPHTGAPADPSGRSEGELRCYEFLDRLGISYLRADHAPADTIALCHEVERVLGAPIPKNLLLCNRQGTRFYLLILPGDKVFKTKYLSQQLGCSRLSFASPEDLDRLLGAAPGSASPLGLLEDRQGAVQLVIDQPVADLPRLGIHPGRNTSTVALEREDFFEKLLPALGHTPVFVRLPEGEEND